MKTFTEFLFEYREEKGGTFRDGKTSYDINKIFKITDSKKASPVAVASLTWIEPNKIPKEDLARAKEVDDNIAIIIVKKGNKNLVVDGYHRMIKAQKSKKKFINAKLMTKDELESTKVK